MIIDIICKKWSGEVVTGGKMIFKEIGVLSLAATFMAGAAASASPHSAVGWILDEAIGQYKQDYIACIDDIYVQAKVTGWTQDVGTKALISVLVRMDCF